MIDRAGKPFKVLMQETVLAPLGMLESVQRWPSRRRRARPWLAITGLWGWERCDPLSYGKCFDSSCASKRACGVSAVKSRAQR